MASVFFVASILIWATQQLFSRLYTFELESRLLYGLADIVFLGVSRHHKRVGGRGGLAGFHTLQFPDGLLYGSLAMVAMHTFYRVNRCPGDSILFFEFVKEFHAQCSYNE